MVHKLEVCFWGSVLSKMSITLHASFVVRIILLLILGIVCFFQVKESVEKYVAKSTTYAINYETRKSSKPPTLVFCPSNLYKSETVLKKNNMSKYDYYTEIGYDYWPSNQNLVESAWKNITYDPWDIFEKIALSTNGQWVEISGSDLTSLFNGESIANITLATLDTIYSGRCYYVKYLNNLTIRDFIFFHFKSGKVVSAFF